MTHQNPVEAATSTPAISAAPEPSRGVNEGIDGPRAIGTTSKDASATPAARRVPAPLLTHQRALWAITILAGAAYIAIAVLLVLKGRL